MDGRNFRIKIASVNSVHDFLLILIIFGIACPAFDLFLAKGKTIKSAVKLAAAKKATSPKNAKTGNWTDENSVSK